MLITENQLDEWVRGNARDAQGIIVELIWRLVAASCPRPRERRFPLPDSIGQHGPDGVLDVELSFEPFIPEGRSYWEVGTGLKAHDKASEDYKGLTDTVPENIRRDTTFVFVTPLSGRRDWEYSWKGDAQAAWLDDRRKRGEWKDIRIIDATILIDWINHFLAVELWLIQKTSGIPSMQIEIPTQHWNVVSSIGEPPPLIPELFLANRTEAGNKLKEVFDGITVQFKLTTHYFDQIVDFISAYLASLGSEDFADAAGRCLIVSGIDGWNTICNNSQWKNHILIADASLDLNGDSGTKLIQKARRASHSVIFSGPHGGIPDPASVPLLMPSGFQIQEALKKAGYKEERARALAQKSGGNLSSLLRCIQNLSVLPAWAERSDAAELAIALLLGSWNEKTDADRNAVEQLSGKAYGEWIKGMREIALAPATPLIQRDGSWKFIPRYEGWYALGQNVFDEHLDKLKSVAITVLGEKDPKFELPTNDRILASIHGKVLSHSLILRNGLAETLALLGSHPKAFTSCSLGKAEVTAILTIREILNDANGIHWASLNDVLPLLAEAAPGEFLDAIDKALQMNPCPFDEVFAQEGNGIFGSNYITGLLWSLETLAWDADYLSRVVICLGELATHDPGGQWANRPANSLTSILLPWFPQTCAPTNKRVAAVKTLLTEFPDVGWKLLVSLLPHQQSSSSGTRKPAWRSTIPDDWREGVTHREYWEQEAIYAELAVNHAKNDVSKLKELIEHLENLPHPVFEQLMEYLNSDSVRALPVDEKMSIWSRLVDLVSKHRKFSDAKWAMEPRQVDEVAALADRLAPDSPFFLHQRLFSERDFDLFEGKGDYERQMEELEKRRQAAVEEVASSGGTEAVLSFAKNVQSPWRVGIAFGYVSALDADIVILPSLLESEIKPLLQFVGGFVWGRFHSRGWEWVDSIMTSDWTPTQTGQFLSFLPFKKDTWERVKDLLGNDQKPYWSKTAANPYEADAGLEFAIDQLARYGKLYSAIQCLNKILFEKKPLESKQAIRVLLEAVKSSEIPNSMDIYDSVEIIKAVQDDPETNPDDLFQVEWAYLPLLDGHHGATPKLLWRRLAEDPSFFCEVIRIVFKSKKEKSLTEEISEKRKTIATNAYRLLSEWRRPPGLLENGSFDGDALKTWLDTVKRECSESGHLEIAMTMVGHVLIYVPADPDGLWINHSVAAFLNEKDSKDMRDGFHTELFNSRGVHWIDPTGKPERDLAVDYREKAEQVENAGYHRLASSLRDLASEYKREAERISSREFPDD
uniref:Uncharacterized protein n=1 Tax=candidate division WOR-3 bacterium TaxID=2052148 RepID=A0A7V3KNK5_UNCW3